MSSGGSINKVLIATLWQQTFEHGNDYLSSILGKIRTIGIRCGPTPRDICLKLGKEWEEASAGRPPGLSSASRRQAAQPAGKPFYDNLIDDVGRGS
jgi:hypothetical protein